MTVVAYYDAFRERLIEDFHVRNKRVVAALEFAKDTLAGSTSILDVGCGIGWSSNEMAVAGAQVTGLDVSPRLVEAADEMFGERCQFVVADFTAWEPDGPYDAVLMIDVYEHFPRETRASVHDRIRCTQATRVALTVPTPRAQQFARDHGIPLQPVDEDVTDEAVQQMARDLGGRVVVNREVTVWRPGDYRHVLIEVPC